jgi:hypothetical protein
MLPVWETIGILNEKRRRECRPPVDSRVMRVRHCMSRYEFADDRKNFSRWIMAPGPTQISYWRYQLDPHRLQIRLHKGGRTMCYNLTIQELEFSRLGWRRMVAQAVRKVRQALNA